MNKRIQVKALLREPWVIIPDDKVKTAMTSNGTLQSGEIARVIRTYYIEAPIIDGYEVVRTGWVDLEIVKPSSRAPAAIGLKISDPVSCIVPAEYVVGQGYGNGGRTFDQFVENTRQAR